MSRDFTFSDLGRVHWGSTIKLMLVRGFAAGLVWAIFTSFGPMAAPMSTNLAWPFIWTILGLPFALVMQFLGMLFGTFSALFGHVFHILGSLMVCIGDPIIYLINRSYPALLNIADLKFFNFSPIMFITYPD